MGIREEPKDKMNTSNPAWRLIILLLLLLIPSVSCQQPKLPTQSATDNTSLETIYEIPEGIEPQRPATYDDIVDCVPFYTYRANCPYVIHRAGVPDRIPGPDFIREAKVTLSGCQFAPDVTYRDNIETKAGETRYNIFNVWLRDSKLRIESANIYSKTGKPGAKYEIKLLGTCPDIQVKIIGESDPPTGPAVGDKGIYLMIEIPPQVKPGEYTLHFVVEANGQNCGELPCVIHVIE
jgi:hypothetical protein